VIDDLDKTITALLRHETYGLPPALGEQVQISFATPDDQFPPQSVTLPAVDVFLYDLRENLELRDGEWELERNLSGGAIRRRPPVRVDCSYLITAWPSDSTPSPAEDEHRLLGEVMKVLLAQATIPEEVLRGSLRGQRPPLPTVSLQPGHLQTLAEFWQALGGKPKAALNFTVTISVDVHEPIEVPLVTEKVIKVGRVAVRQQGDLGVGG
jgi:hypothetical protein